MHFVKLLLQKDILFRSLQFPCCGVDVAGLLLLLQLLLMLPLIDRFSTPLCGNAPTSNREGAKNRSSGPLA